MDTTIETFEHEGLTVKIGWEEYSEDVDPRQWENLGIMVCWHPNYLLGDFQITNPDGHGAVKNRFHRDDFDCLEKLARYVGIVEKAVCILPLTVYEHSGVTMYVGGKHDYPFDTEGWDTTIVGIIYTTPEKVAEAGIAEEDVEKTLRSEVKIYASWLEGEVYYWLVEDSNGDVLDGCGGYVGDIDYVRGEAKASAEWHRKDILVNQEPNFPEALRA